VNYFKQLIAFLTFMVMPRLYVTAGKSTQVTAIDSVDYDLLRPDEAHGRVRMAFWEFTTLAAGGADGDSFAACEIPKGARILGGKCCNEALGAGVVAGIGITGSAAKYGTGIDMAAAGEDLFANTIALNYGVRTTAKERILVVLTGAAPAASKKIYGHILYVVD
jgi:hypothetical protein